MAEEKPTQVVYPRRTRVEDPVRRAFSDLKDMSKELRRMGLAIQSNRLDEILKELEPPSFGGILADLRMSSAWATPKYVWFLAKRIFDGAAIIQALMDDAEITGSIETLERARIWLEQLGISRPRTVTGEIQTG